MVNVGLKNIIRFGRVSSFLRLVALELVSSHQMAHPSFFFPQLWMRPSSFFAVVGSRLLLLLLILRRHQADVTPVLGQRGCV